jgi:hypothetical protein
MPRPRGIIIVKGSFELSDLYNKEFHKMAQNFGMTATYGESKDKAGSATTAITKQPEVTSVEPEAKKLRVQSPNPNAATTKESGTPPA